MSERSRLRLIIVQVLVFSLLGTLFSRLWYVQIVAGERYAQAASANQIREVVSPALRGMILDVQGRPLVNNRTALVVSVSRTELLSQPDRGTGTLRRLAELLRQPYQDLQARISLCSDHNTSPLCWNGLPQQPIPVSEAANPTVALRIAEQREKFPGITAELQPVRQFPRFDGANAAHLLGYLSPVTQEELNRQRLADDRQLRPIELVGRAGVERRYDSDLRGQPEISRLAVDKVGRVIGAGDTTPAAPGNHLVTNVDARLQAVVERELAAAIKGARGRIDKEGRRYQADSGAAVVLDVTDGSVLAMASYPTYEPEVFTGGISVTDYAKLTSEKAGTPLLFRATAGQGPPASTFKVVSTTAAVKEGYSLDATYPCPSDFRVGNRLFRNYESRSHGNITLARSLVVSCDTVFYRIGYDLWLRDGGNDPVDPKDPILSMAKEFGLGKPTGIDLPVEEGGRIPDRAWKKSYWEQMKDEWCARAQSGYPEVADKDPSRASFLKKLAEENCVDGDKYRAGDAVNSAIGQGDLLVTPLQLARVYAAIANGGTLWTPRIGKAVVSPTGTLIREIPAQQAGTLPVDNDTLNYIRRALTDVPMAGTGQGAFAGFPLDEIPVAAKTGTAEVFGKQNTSWFASFAPADKPRYAVVMMVSQGGTGASTSGPAVRNIYQELFGVQGSTVDSSKAILPPDGPPKELPHIRTDGMIGPSKESP